MNEIAINPAELPPSWAFTNLGAVVNYGRTEKAEPTAIADGDWILELEDIEKDSSRLLQKMTFLQRQSKSTKNRFEAGDVLYGKLRPYLNKVVIADGPGYCTTEILPLRAGANLDNRYLFYWLKHPAFLKYVEAESHGMNMPRLGTDAGKAAPFVIAPKGEQIRIANKLDTLIARIQSCNDRFDAIPDLLKRFRQTVLDDAVSGKLSATWRDGRETPLWVKTVIGKCGIVSGGLTKNVKREIFPLRKPYLRVANVQSNRLDLSEVSEIGLTQAEYEKTKLQKDDLLIVEGNGSIDQVGRVAIWASELDDCVHQNHLIRLRTVGPLARWVLLWLQSTPGRECLMELASTTTGLYTLSISKVSSVPIQLPSREEQAEIVQRVETLFALAERIEARATAARTHAKRLAPVLLAKAFRGELLPQDPSEQPATLLLSEAAVLRKKQNADQTAKVKRRKVVMKESPTETLKQAIAGLKRDRFTFNDVRSLVGGDYESLKDALIGLLQDKSSGLRQVFDEASGEMQFLRGGK